MADSDNELGNKYWFQFIEHWLVSSRGYKVTPYIEMRIHNMCWCRGYYYAEDDYYLSGRGTTLVEVFDNFVKRWTSKVPRDFVFDHMNIVIGLQIHIDEELATNIEDEHRDLSSIVSETAYFDSNRRHHIHKMIFDAFKMEYGKSLLDFLKENKAAEFSSV